jgi:hypothetical protein
MGVSVPNHGYRLRARLAWSRPLAYPWVARKSSRSLGESNPQRALRTCTVRSILPIEILIDVEHCANAWARLRHGRAAAGALVAPSLL